VIEKEIDARVALGITYMQIGYYNEAKTCIEKIMDSASINKQRLSQVLTILAVHNYTVEENFNKYLKNIQKALKLSDKSGDFFSQVKKLRSSQTIWYRR
jgi:tetratricopeptide (TPR) repeat protein